MKKVMMYLVCLLLAELAFAEMPKGVNLLLNPGFEDFPDSVAPWINDGAVGISVSTADKVSGLQSMQIHYNSDYDAAYQQFSGLDDKDRFQTYRVSFSVKSLQAKPLIIRASIWEFNGGYKFHESPWYWVTTSWQTITFEATLTQANISWIRAVIQCAPQDSPKTAGQFLVDDVVFKKPVPEPTLVAPVPNGAGNVSLNPDLQWTPANVSNWPSIVDPNASAVRTAQYLYIKASDSDFTNMTPVILGADDTSKAVGPLSEYTNYYWTIDTGIDGSGPGRLSDPNENDPNTLIGPVWSFRTRGSVSINTEPVGGYFDPGSSVSLTVVATSASPSLSYSWYQSSDRIADAGDTSVGTNSATLLVTSNALQVNEGYYYCVVTDGFDNVTTDLVWVGVKALKGQWKLDGNFEDQVSGPSGWTGSLFNYDTGLPADPNWTIGADKTNPGAHEFITDHDYINIADTGAAGVFNFYTKGLTLSAWIKRYNDGTYSGIMGKQQSADVPAAGDPWTGYFMYITTSNRLVLRFTSEANCGSNGSILNDGKWHFVAATYDVNTETMSLYIDGKLDKAQSNLPSALSEAQIGRMTTDLVIAAEDYLGRTQFVNGALDDVRIYNYPLSLAEVETMYYALDYWHCDNPLKSEVDVNGDCKIDMADFAAMAMAWLECGRVPVEKCGL